jgi:hypothetical protein
MASVASSPMRQSRHSVAVETAVRTHRRYRDWRRTSGVIGAWTVGVGACALAVTLHSAWPLIAIPVAGAVVVAGEVASRVQFARACRFRPPQSRPGSDPTSDPDGDSEAVPADPGEQYRVIYTRKADHIETRRYADGRKVTVDTRTGAVVPDPWQTF